jgi:bis(5'-nucleosidyl)-tetraphosphatase
VNLPAEQSAGAIIFRKEDQQVFYLLLHYEGGHWGSAKGHIENGETLAETARREIREETALTDIHFIKDFKEFNRYFFFSQGKRIFKIVTFLLAETHSREVTISSEHTGYAWLPFESALERITFTDEKKVLQKAHDFISSQGL